MTCWLFRSRLSYLDFTIITIGATMASDGKPVQGLLILLVGSVVGAFGRKKIKIEHGVE